MSCLFQLEEDKGTLKLQVSLDGVHFAQGQFPPGLGIENKAVRLPTRCGTTLLPQLTLILPAPP
jgi:hypothetical protein